MRNTISLWACLAIFCGQLMATEPNNTASTTKNTETELTSEKNSEKEEVVFIPNRKLEVELISEIDLLRINLTGQSEQLDWIIFQPKGEVISRISTSTMIDEIKLNNLETGQYVLMIKDTKGRMLYKMFEKA